MLLQALPAVDVRHKLYYIQVARQEGQGTYKTKVVVCLYRVDTFLDFRGPS